MPVMTASYFLSFLGLPLPGTLRMASRADAGYIASSPIFVHFVFLAKIEIFVKECIQDNQQ